MRIVHVIQGLVKTGGTSVFCVEVANHQAALGHDVTIFYNTETYYPADQRVAVVRGDSLDELGFRPDIVHVHCLLAFFPVKCMRWCRRNNVPYVVSPHGGLMPRVFAKARIKKHVFFELFLRSNLNKAQGIHCTGEGEQDAVHGLGIKCKTFVVPLGCHLPEWPVKKLPSDKKTMLFLSRISEEKGLVHLLDAWKRVPHDGWRLVIAGPDWRGYQAILEAKIATERIADVEFPGEADKILKDRLYRQADVFILPSPMENFSMVVLDALAYGVPVVCTRGTPWASIRERHCGWWIRPNLSEELLAVIKDVRSLDAAKFLEMSKNARLLATEFDWGHIVERLNEEYTVIRGFGVENNLLRSVVDGNSAQVAKEKNVVMKYDSSNDRRKET